MPPDLLAAHEQHADAGAQRTEAPDREAIQGYDSDVEEVALISATARSDWTPVQAIRSRITARARKTELLSIAGVLSDARTELDVRAVAEAVMVAFEDHGA